MIPSLTRTMVAVAAGAAVMIPAMLVEIAEDRGGIGEVDNVDFLAVSSVLAAGTAVCVAVLFGRAIARGYRRGDVLVATFDGVVATTIAAVASLVAFLLLHVREEEAIGEGVGVELATWATLHLVSLGLGLAASRAALRWMARGRLRS